MLKEKQLFMIGGPNGAGKTTSAFTLMPELIHCSEYVNADAIAASLSPFKPAAIAVKSGKLMLEHIHELIKHKQNFAFEATMASKNFTKLLNDCKQQGYQINLLFVWVSSYELSIQRVNLRAKAGGHHIPEEVVKRRYHRSIHNFINLYLPLADRWVVCDNTYEDPLIIAQKHKSRDNIEIYSDDLWDEFKRGGS